MSKKKTTKLIEDFVYSPINDEHINSNITKSPVWKNCFHGSEYAENLSGYTKMYKYTVKFDGTIPVQMTKVQRIK